MLACLPLWPRNFAANENAKINSPSAAYPFGRHYPRTLFLFLCFTHARAIVYAIVHWFLAYEVHAALFDSPNHAA